MSEMANFTLSQSPSLEFLISLDDQAFAHEHTCNKHHDGDSSHNLVLPLQPLKHKHYSFDDGNLMILVGES